MPTSPDIVCQFTCVEDEQGKLRWKFLSSGPLDDVPVPPLCGDVADGMLFVQAIPLLEWPNEKDYVAVCGKYVIDNLIQFLKCTVGLPTSWDDYKEALATVVHEINYKPLPSAYAFMDDGAYCYLQIWLYDAAPHFLNEVLDEAIDPRLCFRLIAEGQAGSKKFLKPADWYKTELRYEPLACRSAEWYRPFANDYSFNKAQLYRLVNGVENFTVEPFYAFFTESRGRPGFIGGCCPNWLVTYRWFSDPGRPFSYIRFLAAHSQDRTIVPCDFAVRSHDWDGYKTEHWAAMSIREFLTCHEGATVDSYEAFHCTITRCAIDTVPTYIADLIMHEDTMDMENACITGVNHSSYYSTHHSQDILIPR